MSKPKFRMYLDIVLFIAFLVMNMPQFTGLALHEWLSFAFIPIIVVHVVLDWPWIVSITKRFLKSKNGQNRFNYLLNLLMFFLMVTAMFSGIMISEEAIPRAAVSFAFENYWSTLHALSARLLTLIIGIHLAMHWKWIVNTTNRYLFKRNEPEVVAEQGANSL